MSSYSEGQTHQLMNALEKANFTAGEITTLAQDGEFLKSVRLALKGVLTFTKASLSIWKTIEIGGKTAVDLERELDKKGLPISKEARTLFNKIAVGEPRVINLARMTVKDLGFEDPDHWPMVIEVFIRIKELGGSLCPAEAALHLRLAYGDQARNECPWMAMEPLMDSEDHPHVFKLFLDRGIAEGSRGKWLAAKYTSPRDRWSPETLIIFVATS